jgi:hypothetical protein
LVPPPYKPGKGEHSPASTCPHNSNNM